MDGWPLTKPREKSKSLEVGLNTRYRKKKKKNEREYCCRRIQSLLKTVGLYGVSGAFTYFYLNNS